MIDGSIGRFILNSFRNTPNRLQQQRNWVLLKLNGKSYGMTHFRFWSEFSMNLQWRYCPDIANTWEEDAGCVVRGPQMWQCDTVDNFYFFFFYIFISFSNHVSQTHISSMPGMVLIISAVVVWHDTRWIRNATSNTHIYCISTQWNRSNNTASNLCAKWNILE